MAKAIITIDDDTGTEQLSVRIEFDPALGADILDGDIPKTHKAALLINELLTNQGEN